MIHKTAIIGNNVQLGSNVNIDAYTIIEDDVKIADNTTIKHHVIIRSSSTIQENCYIDSFAVIGGEPQDISFDHSKKTGVIIGKGTIIREHATVHRATTENSSTIVGNNCYVMSGAHVGHDCIVEDNVILANCSLLGGFVTVGNHSFIGGNSALHQFVRVGEYVILGGYSASSLDLPPYTMSADRSSIVGLNIVGLKRANFSSEKIAEIKKCLSLVYNTTGKYAEVAQNIINSCDLKFLESQKFLKFFMESSKKGIAPLRRHKKQK